MAAETATKQQLNTDLKTVEATVKGPGSDVKQQLFITSYRFRSDCNSRRDSSSSYRMPRLKKRRRV